MIKKTDWAISQVALKSFAVVFTSSHNSFVNASIKNVAKLQRRCLQTSAHPIGVYTV